MDERHLFSAEIIKSIRAAQEAVIIQPVKVGKTDRQNELVFFIKPELLNVADDGKILNSLGLIERKFDQFDVHVEGAAIVPGATLEKFEIMNRHYGFINQLSRAASQSIDPETRARLFKALGKEDPGTHQIFGGHEFLQHFKTDIDTLNKIWFAQEALKLRSGFYFIEDTRQGQPFLLVNGFHPSQLAHYTREDNRILLMLLHTDTDWVDLKFDLVGDTFPERAKPGSIRGTLFEDPDAYGQDEVVINTNGVHLSAGPYEAAFEVVNFFGPLLNLNPIQTPPLAIERTIRAGIPADQALSLLDNPLVNDEDLFSETENLNTEAAVDLAVQLFV